MPLDASAFGDDLTGALPGGGTSAFAPALLRTMQRSTAVVPAAGGERRNAAELAATLQVRCTPAHFLPHDLRRLITCAVQTGTRHEVCSVRLQQHDASRGYLVAAAAPGHPPVSWAAGLWILCLVLWICAIFNSTIASLPVAATHITLRGLCRSKLPSLLTRTQSSRHSRPSSPPRPPPLRKPSTPLPP
jgi:hypothetical protein